MRKVLAFTSCLAGCGLSVVGAADSSDDAGTGKVESSLDAATLIDATAAEASTDSGTCNPTKCEGLRCVADKCDYYADCRELSAAHPPSSGIYKFRGFEAYCETTLAGGGWTLVGQSAPTPTTGDFGWGSTLGSVSADNQAYSINALEKKLAIHEILIATGTRSSIRTAYILKPSDGFPTGYENVGRPNAITAVMNPDCPKAGDAVDNTGPHMLHNSGFTASKKEFWLRDFTDGQDYGLQRNKLFLLYDDCANAALMNDRQGMIFVR